MAEGDDAFHLVLWAIMLFHDTPRMASKQNWRLRKTQILDELARFGFSNFGLPSVLPRLRRQ
jgi:hypothetical protein